MDRGRLGLGRLQDFLRHLAQAVKFEAVALGPFVPRAAVRIIPRLALAVVMLVQGFVVHHFHDAAVLLGLETQLAPVEPLSVVSVHRVHDVAKLIELAQLVKGQVEALDPQKSVPIVPDSHQILHDAAVVADMKPQQEALGLEVLQHVIDIPMDGNDPPGIRLDLSHLPYEFQPALGPLHKVFLPCYDWLLHLLDRGGIGWLRHRGL